MRLTFAVVAVLSGIGLGHSLVAAQPPALRYSVREAIDAIKADDCAKLGAMVNGELDTNPAMQLVAGVIHEEGYCVDRSTERARRYYDVAKGSADMNSLLDLGLHYAQGDALPKSYSKAGAWFAQAATKEGVARLPKVADLPVEQPTAETEWNGYVMSVWYVGSRMIRYPRDALARGYDGEFLAKVCLVDGQITTSVLEAKRDPASGVAAMQATRSMASAIDDSYERVLRVMPPPALAPSRNTCFESPISFRIRPR